MRALIIIGYLVAQTAAVMETCTWAIDRLKQGPEDYAKVLQEGRKWEDPTFNGRDQLYWLGYTPYGKVRDYEMGFAFKGNAFQRLGDVYPTATMWGNNNPQWHDIMQGMAGTCYIEASMASIAEFPDLVKNIFVTTEKNDEGIYAFRLFIRGKPWIVTVDDYFLFHNETNVDTNVVERTPYYARPGKNNQFWAMLIEKAYAKFRGNYEQANGGFIETGLRMLIGSPVMSYQTNNSNPDVVFATLMTANTLNYVMGAGTIGASDTTLNECRVANSHAYSIMAAFQLMNADGVTVDHKLYMMRNPWGVSYYNQSWNSNDAAWTSAYKAQVPHGVDPTTSQAEGIFFTSSVDFLTCFQDYQIAHYRDLEGYTDDWYDQENDDGKLRDYEIEVPAKDGDLYFTAETYYQGAVPKTCWGGFYPTVSLKLYKNDVEIDAKEYMETFHQPFQVLEADYAAGDKFKLSVKYDWQFGLKSYPARDYTVKVYSKQDLQVKDSNGNTNMWHMDGQFPSAFTKSHYRTETTKYTPEFKPRSMQDAWIASNNLQQFMHLVSSNPHTLYVWFN